MQEEAIRIGLEKGMQQGMQQGIQETSKLVIQSLLQHFPDYTDEQISKVSNLPLEMVTKVRNDMKEKNGTTAKPKRKGTPKSQKNSPPAKKD